MKQNPLFTTVIDTVISHHERLGSIRSLLGQYESRLKQIKNDSLPAFTENSLDEETAVDEIPRLGIDKERLKCGYEASYVEQQRQFEVQIQDCMDLFCDNLISILGVSPIVDCLQRLCPDVHKSVPSASEDTGKQPGTLKRRATEELNVALVKQHCGISRDARPTPIMSRTGSQSNQILAVESASKVDDYNKQESTPASAASESEAENSAELHLSKLLPRPSDCRMDASSDAGLPCLCSPKHGPRLAPIIQKNAQNCQPRVAGTIIFDRAGSSYARRSVSDPPRLAPIIEDSDDNSTGEGNSPINLHEDAVPLSRSSAVKRAFTTDRTSTDPMSKRLRPRHSATQDIDVVMTAPSETLQAEEPLEFMDPKGLSSLKRKRASRSTDLLGKVDIKAAGTILEQLKFDEDWKKPNRRGDVSSSKERFEDYLVLAGSSRPSKKMQLVIYLFIGGWRWSLIAYACGKIFGDTFKFESLRAAFHARRKITPALNRAIYGED